MTTNNLKTAGEIIAKQVASEILAEQSGDPGYATRDIRGRVALMSSAYARLTAESIGDKIKALEASILALSGFDPREEVEAIQKENTKLVADAAKARKEADEAIQRVNTFTQEKAFAEFNERIATLEKENAALAALDQDIERRATAKACDAMASVGFVGLIGNDAGRAYDKPVNHAASLTEQCLIRRNS